MSERMHGSELIIGDKGELYHINLKGADGVPGNLLLVGETSRAEEVAKFFDEGIEGSAQHREFFTVWGKYKGHGVAAMGTGIGTDNTEIASVESHAMHEYDVEDDSWAETPAKRTIIRVGTSGSPRAHIPVGSLGIARHAIGLDNTGLYYLHYPTPEGYEDKEFGPFYTPDNEGARLVFEEVRKQLWHTGVVRPYVSTATPAVVKALEDAAVKNGMPLEQGVGAYTGITSSASGFFGPQGRRIGRLQNILIPDLQDRLAAISARFPGGPGGLGSMIDMGGGEFQPAGSRRELVVNNEMESSALFRLNGEILGHNTGAVSIIIANRNKGEFIPTKEAYADGVRKAIKVALDAIVALNFELPVMP